MKKYLLLLVIPLLALSSCEEDDPAPLILRAASAEFFFDASQANAVQNPDGTYTITATGSRGTIILNIRAVTEGFYQFNGAGNGRYETTDGRVYATQALENGDPGFVRIDESIGTIRGRFKLVGFSGNDTIEFFTGEFQNIFVGAPEPAEEEGE